MIKVYKFTAAFDPQCISLDKELARIKGGLPIQVVDLDSSEGQVLATTFGVRRSSTLVKTRRLGGEETVFASLVGFKHSRETFEKFLEV